MASGAYGVHIATHLDVTIEPPPQAWRGITRFVTLTFSLQSDFNAFQPLSTSVIQLAFYLLYRSIVVTVVLTQFQMVSPTETQSLQLSRIGFLLDRKLLVLKATNFGAVSHLTQQPSCLPYPHEFDMETDINNGSHYKHEVKYVSDPYAASKWRTEIILAR